MLPQNKQPPDIAEYVNATSLEMALAALGDGQGTALAGGSDLWAQKDNGNGRVRRRLVNITRVPELVGITEVGGGIRLGALTTMTEVLESKVVQAKAPVLAVAADHFASPQIRNVATIGGNIANASPAADMVLPLIALGAMVELCSVGKKRLVPLDGFSTSPGKSQMAPDELITAVEFETPGSGAFAVFCKSGPRPALEISVVAMAMVATRQNATLSNPRIVFGAVGPTSMRCPATEALIDGKPLTDDLIAQALDVMAGEISPIDDFRASAWYRTQMARTFLEQELLACR